jgi:hypothetical protein
MLVYERLVVIDVECVPPPAGLRLSSATGV